MACIFKPKTYLAALFTKPSKPKYVAQALTDRKWFQAIKEKYNALQVNQTWVLIALIASVKVIGNKWVFRKYNYDGSVSRYKVRLVAKGFH